MDMVEVADIDAIDMLARANKRSVQEVTQIYVEEFARLKATARIQNYLALLTSRHVRDVLHGASERKLSKKNSAPQLPEPAQDK